MEHDGCVGCKYENEDANSKHCLGCKQNAIDKYAPMTNSDRIRSMSDEELAEFLLKVNTANEHPCMIDGGDCKWEDYPTRNKGCKDCFLEYLRKEVKGSE